VFDGWNAYVNHRPLLDHYKTAEAAKQAAEAEAWRVLAGALAKLPVPAEAADRAITKALGMSDELPPETIMCAALLAALGGE
jgi:hypothetical protein